jgi:hypothetical protein
MASFLNNVNFFDLFSSCDDVSSDVNNFYSVIFDAFNPFVTLRNNFKSNCRSHYPFIIRRLFCKKSTAWKQYRTFRTQQLLAKYKSIASQCRSAIYAHHVEVENRVINSDNIDKFYRYANRKFTSKTVIRPLKSNNGDLVIDPTRKAELLQTIFTSMFTLDDGLIPVFSTPSVTNSSLGSVIFSAVLANKLFENSRLSPKEISMTYLQSSLKHVLNNLLHL